LNRYIKKYIIGIVLFLCFFLIPATHADAFWVDASSAILIDANSGKILYQQNPHAKLPPASTTKILTALIALEKGDLSQKITVPADFVDAGEASIWLEPGETHTLEDLMYAMLLRSANDAAQVIAIGIAGSEDKFVEMMNTKTTNMGLKDSSWANPHGLNNENHYTSAYDLAYIARAATKIPTFNTIIKTQKKQMPWQDNPYNRVVYNRNQYLTLYDGADGIKTGYTKEAGSCLVASATRNGMRLIGVVMHCNGMYKQMAAMMDYGFKNYDPYKVASAGDVMGTVTVKGGKQKTVDAVLKTDLAVTLPAGSTFKPTATIDLPEKLETPLSVDKPIGTVTCLDADGNKTTANLYPATNLERYTFFGVISQAFSRIFNVLLV